MTIIVVFHPDCALRLVADVRLGRLLQNVDRPDVDFQLSLTVTLLVTLAADHAHQC